MSSMTHAYSPRLAPIDRPRGLLLRLFNWLTRRTFGKVIMPSRVLYTRFPTLLWRTMPLYHLLDRGLSLESSLRRLIEIQVSLLNGCSFCSDLHRAHALLARVPDEKLSALGGDSFCAPFDARERAALRYVTEIARTGASDEAFEQLRASFDEKEIVEITWLQAFVTYLNRMAVPLGIGSDGLCELAQQRTAH
jgi:AhpD family alkylhydroperoxidase